MAALHWLRVQTSQVRLRHCRRRNVGTTGPGLVRQHRSSVGARSGPSRQAGCVWKGSRRAAGRSRPAALARCSDVRARQGRRVTGIQSNRARKRRESSRTRKRGSSVHGNIETKVGDRIKAVVAQLHAGACAADRNDSAEVRPLRCRGRTGRDRSVLHGRLPVRWRKRRYR